MSKYYLSSVKYEKMAEYGDIRPVTGQYLSETPIMGFYPARLSGDAEA